MFLAGLVIQGAMKKSVAEVRATIASADHEKKVRIRTRDDPVPALTVTAWSAGDITYDADLEAAMQRAARCLPLGTFTGRELSLWSRSPSVCSLNSLHRLQLHEDTARPGAKVGLLIIDNMGDAYTKVQASAFSKLRYQDDYAVRWLVPRTHERGPWYSHTRTEYSTYIGALKSLPSATLTRDVDVLCVMIAGISEPEVPDRREIAFAERVWMSGNLVPIVTSRGSLLICPMAPEHRRFLDDLTDAPHSGASLFRNVRHLMKQLPTCSSCEWVRVIVR